MAARWTDDCPAVRPCDVVACRYHLAGRVGARHSCALDAADEGGMSTDDVAEHLGVTGERVRQIEAVALERLTRRVLRLAG